MAVSRKDNKGRVLRKGESQRSDGRYIYQYTDPTGNRRVTYANDLLELREKEKFLIKDQLDGLESYCSGKTTLNYVFDRYIATKFDLKQNTRTNYKYMYDHCVRDTFGKKVITDIKYSDVKFFYYSLINEGGLKTNTLDTIHTVLHPTLEMAVRDGIIRNNPSNGVMSEIKKNCGKNKGIRHALTLEQQRAFLSYVSKSPIYFHWLPLLTVLFGTGCRIGEIIGLRWEDVDYENRFISINHATIYMFMEETHKSEFHISTPKTEARVRHIPMLEAVDKAFKDEYEAQKETGFNTQVVEGMSGFIFCSREGKLLNPSVINRAIRRIYEAYNAEEIISAKKQRRKPIMIPHFSCHHIRHTFCTRFCENETNLKVIQNIMGHANIETTMDIYAEATELKKQEAMKALEKNSDIF
ncbi:MAG TPA: site-specific integrase [Lachnospiraceae bacterium]|nr:site-specific integrase [Lachnospiraceae bacterium]